MVGGGPGDFGQSYTKYYPTKKKTVGKVRNVVSPQYALLAKGTFHFTIYNVTFGKSKVADVDIFGS